MTSGTGERPPPAACSLPSPEVSLPGHCSVGQSPSGRPWECGGVGEEGQVPLGWSSGLPMTEWLHPGAVRGTLVTLGPFLPPPCCRLDPAFPEPLSLATADT